MSHPEEWSSTASDNETVPDGPAEGWVGADVNDRMRDMMAGLREWYDAPEWIDVTKNLSPFGPKTLQQGSATQLDILNCDGTAYFTAGRRIQIQQSTVPVYGFIDSSTFNSPNTEVTVTLDSGSVPPSPDAVYLFHATQVGNAAFKDEGSGNGLDADTVDGFNASDLTASRNEIISGDFQVWQRGTTFGAGGALSAYTADRWRYNSQGDGVTVTRQEHTIGQTDVPNEPRYFLRAVQAAAGTAPALIQRIEGVRTLADTEVTLSFYAKAGGAISVVPKVRQYFGSGGTASASVTQTGTTASVTTGWQRFTATVTLPSISGKTLDGEDDYLEVRIEGPTGAGYTLDISDVQIESGSSASTYIRNSFAEEMAGCQRFYNKTFDYDVTPEQASGVFAGAVYCISVSGMTEAAMWQFPATMRAGGTGMTVTTYNPTQANANWRRNDDSEDRPVSGVATDDKGTRSVVIQSSSSPDGPPIAIHASADAEL